MAKRHLAHAAHFTSDDWTVVAPTMAGVSVERRDFLPGSIKVAVEKAIMIASRIPVDYWATLRPIKRKVRSIPGLMAVWSPFRTRNSFQHQGLPWEELQEGAYVNDQGQLRMGSALTLCLEKVVEHGAKRIRILGVDDTVDKGLRATLNAIVLEGRRQGLDIQIPRADTLITVRRRAF